MQKMYIIYSVLVVKDEKLRTPRDESGLQRIRMVAFCQPKGKKKKVLTKIMIRSTNRGILTVLSSSPFKLVPIFLEWNLW